MGAITQTGNDVYRDFVDPGSAVPNKPAKSEIRSLFAVIDAALSSLVEGVVIGDAVVYSTRSALYADLAHAAGTLGVVYNDGTSAYNGVYVKSGGSGSGSWSITNLALPSTFATDLNALVNRTITGGGLVTGGGTLAANRVLTVTAATQSEADAGVSTMTAVTPSVLPGAVKVGVDKVVTVTEVNPGYFEIANEAGQVFAYWDTVTGTLDLPGIKIVDDGDPTFYLENPVGQPVNAPWDNLTGGGDGSDFVVPHFVRGKVSDWHANIAEYGRTGIAQPHVMFVGNSNVERLNLPNGLAAVIHAEFTKAGVGWIACNSDGSTAAMPPVTLVKNNWTFYDGSAHGVAPPYGCGIDGQCIYTSGTNADAVWSGLDSQFTLFFGQYGGTFRYRVGPSGSWQTVSSPNTGGRDKRVINMGSQTSLYVDTVGNGGIVAIHGADTRNPTANGAIVSKAGNSGLQGRDWALWAADNIPAIAAVVKPHHIVVVNSTNEYVDPLSDPVSSLQHNRNMVAAWRSVLPNVGFTFIVEGPTDRVALNPLSDYVDLFYKELHLIDGHGLYNMPAQYPTYAAAFAMGLWLSDGLHFSPKGGYLVGTAIKNHFLDI